MEDNPELSLINQFQYKTLQILGVDIYFSQEKSNIKFTLEDIEAVLTLVPQKHRELIPRIYVVNYLCQDNPKTKGRHLANLNYLVLYPNAQQELKEVLLHEIGHIVWDRKLTPQERVSFYSAMLKEIPVTSAINDEMIKMRRRLAPRLKSQGFFASLQLPHF